MRAAVTWAETLLARRSAGVIVPGVSRAARWRRVGVDPVVLRNVGRTRPRPVAARRWDVASVGLQAHERRPDLLVELARRRPDLRVAIGGAGRIEHEIRAAAQEIPQPRRPRLRRGRRRRARRRRSDRLRRGSGTPYSPIACPNTLYQAVRQQRPLVFYCGGELEEAARRFRIGIRCAADPEALSAAVDAALARSDWEFDAAWTWLRDGAEDAFAGRMRTLLRLSP